MTYEEAIAELLRVAGDYKNVSNAHDIEEAICKRNTTRLKDEVDKVVAELTLAPETVKIYVEHGVFIVEAFGLKSKTWDTIYDVDLLDSTRRSFTGYLDKAFKDFLNKCLYSSSITMKDIQRFCSHANLILNSVTPEVIDSLSKLGKELRQVDKDLSDETENYNKYCSNLKKAMYNAAELWLDETSIEPDMKLSIRDLRVVDGKTDVRTVKRAKTSNGEFSISFKETSTVVKDNARIDVLESWLINNPQFLEMSKVLKDPKLDKLY